MRILITQRNVKDPEAKEVTIKVDGESRTFQSAAAVLAEDQHVPFIDEELRNIVMRCQAVNVADRPSLEWLNNELTRQIATKDEDYYNAGNLVTWPLETNRSIGLLLNELIYNP